ncbi:MAG: hypothetical protein KC910_05965 [Candidatus Eremiobacteraeota bacterium]|nr:hypothetical protein [Candidatus Eremiobacteraeota bacterium]
MNQLEEPSRQDDHGVDLPLLGMLLLLPLQWKGTLAVNLGFFLLGIGQIPFWIVFLLLTLRPHLYLRFFRCAPVFHCLFLAYYLWLGISLFWAKDLGASLLLYRASIRALIFYFVMGAHLSGMTLKKASRTAALAAPLAVLLFIGYGVYAVKNTPPRDLRPGARQLAEGDPRRILLLVVNYNGEEAPDREDPEFQTATVKNQIAAGFNVLFYLFMIFATADRRRLFNPFTVLAMVLYPVVILGLLSRSNFGALLIGCGMVVICYQLSPLSNRAARIRSIALALLALVACGLVASLKGGVVQDFVDAQESRYASTGDDVRFPHYRKVFLGITREPFFGYGIGRRASDGYAVHNIFLGSWFETGVLGLALTLFYYTTLVYYFCCCLLDLIKGRLAMPPRVANFFWLPAILTVPLVRTLIMGAWGRFQNPDMIAVAFFIVLYEDARRNSLAEPQPCPQAS